MAYEPTKNFAAIKIHTQRYKKK